MVEKDENVDTGLRRRFEKLKDESLTTPAITVSQASSRRSSLGSTSDNEHLAFSKAEEFRLKAEELGQKLTEKFEHSFQDMIDNLSVEMQENTKKVKKSLHLNEYDENGLKKFVARESLLTELFEIQHIQSIYNVFIAVLFVFLMNTLIYDYFQYGSVLNHFYNLSWAFGKTTNLIGWWLRMQTYTLLIFPLYTVFLSNQLSKMRLPAFLWLFPYAIYMMVLFYFPIRAVFVEDFPPATTTILIAEQVRFMMKVHAFVRVNTCQLSFYLEKKKQKKDSKEMEEFEYPGFSQYLYFLFIPTLIYRSSYPMTPHIRWKFVVINLLQVMGCVTYTYFIFARFCVPAFQNTGKEEGNLRVLLLSAFSCMVPGMLLLLVAFFCILHSWMNAFAEMTRFADRMFYRDWWNAKSYSSYYRMWNVVVHDWLYAYIYKDFYRLFGHQGRAAITVFFISAVVHEYILAIAFRFFYPALLFMFGGVGLVFFFVKPRRGSRNIFWNIYVWTSLCMGSGILMTMYSVEWYASRNCHRNFDTWVDFLLPYSFDSTCVAWEWRDINNFTLAR